MALAERMAFFDGGFRYLGRDYAMADVRHVDWWQGEDTQTGSHGKPIPRYKAKLVVHLANGRKLPIMANVQAGRMNTTIIPDVHKVMCDAAERLLARSFDARMDAYEAELKARGYTTWGRYQITPRGELFYRHAHCLHVNDPQVRCMLYPTKLVCLPRAKRWWKRLLMRMLNTAETLDLTRDRDCLLYFLRKYPGLFWPNEVLRLHRGVPAEGLPKVEEPPVPPQAQPVRDEAPQGRAEPRAAPPPPPPPPPPPKPRLGEEHYMAVMGLKPPLAWAEVKTTYRTLAKRHHPDLMRGRGAAAREIAAAEERLKQINEAFAWLEDYYRLKP